MKNKGFTLVEVIVVITLLGILVVFAATSIFKFINSSQESANKNSLKDVQDAALTYGLTLFIPDSCAIESLLTETNPNISVKQGCTNQTVTVQDLIDQQYFKDEANVLKRDGIITIYKYKDSHGNIEVKAFAPSSILK